MSGLERLKPQVDALDFGRVPAVELGFAALGHPACRLLPDLAGLGQDGAQRVADSLSDRAELALQSAPPWHRWLAKWTTSSLVPEHLLARQTASA